ncbi:MAG: hypothetical protein KGI28_07530 [Thaumarchaeota archaeon]|nr:hypothetical protein [Nitrososphaerota archaeon]
MSEDLVSKIEELIKSERGDVGRLQDILTAIKKGESTSFDDNQYIESLTQSQSPSNTSSSDNIVTDSKPENAFDNVISEPSPEVPSPQVSHKETPKKTPVRKYASVGIVVAIILVAYIGLDVYAVNNLQFRPHHGQQVVISDTQLAIKSDACNPAYFPATFTKYEITAFYNSDEIEKATISGSTLSPKSAATLDGIFAINKDAVAKIAKENATFDGTKATITTSVDAPIFGIIPYQVDKQYPAQEFQNRIKNPPPGTFDCM